MMVELMEAAKNAYRTDQLKEIEAAHEWADPILNRLFGHWDSWLLENVRHDKQLGDSVEIAIYPAGGILILYRKGPKLHWRSQYKAAGGGWHQEDVATLVDLGRYLIEADLAWP
jgi:hypothetical protein